MNFDKNKAPEWKFKGQTANNLIFSAEISLGTAYRKLGTKTSKCGP